MERDNRIDVIKAIAICSVVLGHSVQFIGYQWSINLTNFIYSFQMALFFFVSGYFADGFKSKFVTFYGGIKAIFKKVIRLIVPWVAWNFVGIVAGVIRAHLWFLEALFIIFLMFAIVVSVMRLTKKDEVIVLIILSGFVGVVLAFVAYKFSITYLANAIIWYPIFLIGYLVKVDNRLENFIANKYIIDLSILLYAFCLSRFDFGNTSVPGSVWFMHFYRAVCGCCMVIMVWNLVNTKSNSLNRIKLLSLLGRKSMYIYLLEPVIKLCLPNADDIVTVFCITFCVIAVGLIAGILMEKSKVIDFIFFGNR